MAKELKLSLHPNQWKVWSDPSRFRVLVAGRRFGKTTLADNELFQNALKHPGSLNWYVGPTYKQAKMIAWRMLKDLVPDELISKVNESELVMELTNKSLIELRGCDNPDSLRGVGVSFAVVDEYGVIPDGEMLWGEVLRPMLIDTQGKALFIGTPKGLNAFFTLYQKGVEEQDGFKSFRFTSYDNPFISKNEIEQMRKELPPRMFEQEVMASFLVSSENILIKLEDLEALKGVNFYEGHSIRHISCDPALGGDECVVYVFDNTEVIDERILFYDDPLKIAGTIAELARRYDVEGISIDNDALGKAILSHLSGILKKDISIVPITSGEKASDPLRFGNRRTEVWWHAWQMVKDQVVKYPKDLEIRRQLSNVEYKVADNRGKVLLVPKKETKKMLGHSPDRADAFVYGLWGLKHIMPKKPNYYKDKRAKWFKNKRSPYGWTVNNA